VGIYKKKALGLLGA